MKEFFEYSKELTVNDVDASRKLSLMHITEILQLLANGNAERGGYGFAGLLKNNNAFWVLTKIKLVCGDLPKHKEKITCKTWPIKPSKLTLERDFEIRGANGDVVIAATSEWCLIDADTRRIKRIEGDTVMPGLDYIEDRAIVPEYTKQKIEISDEDFCYDRVIRSTDIDMNGHTNNTKYTLMAVDCFSNDFLLQKAVNNYEIHFVKECVEGDKLTLYCKKIGENSFYITSLKNESQVVFRAFIDFR